MNELRGTVIPESTMINRLRQAEQLQDFFLQMWRQNPSLSANAGERIRAMLTPAAAPPK